MEKQRKEAARSCQKREKTLTGVCAVVKKELVVPGTSRAIFDASSKGFRDERERKFVRAKEG